ncbi:hypothetical protein [Nonomuraea basaltis]|uniref:hypothetical protein n=1 Tax=Nonomuraea basaltis TaxID=2495887 RepID=UPI00110C54A6|nr:hypothetical protein [Nonomuraea basaltis]TMR90112.1 hypothetical protein EJK15_57065 [Nonomuraea basaltis]
MLDRIRVCGLSVKTAWSRSEATRAPADFHVIFGAAQDAFAEADPHAVRQVVQDVAADVVVTGRPPEQSAIRPRRCSTGCFEQLKIPVTAGPGADIRPHRFGPRWMNEHRA